jgi:hypothetical protein
MAKFSLTKELKTIGEIHDVSRQIFDTMPDNVLFSKSKEELCFNVLNEFDFPTGTINVSDIASLEQGCKTIMALMGIDDDFEKTLLLGKEEKFENQLDRFLHYFLDFTGLPGVFKEQLELKVQTDLDKINTFITEYEKIDFIQKGETPRNHNQRTQNDFYKRCVDEKAKIVTHLATGINERALSKAKRDRLWGMAEMMFEEFRDRPYKLPMPKSTEYFDVDKIDKVGHRLGEIAISKGRELKQLYKQDKEKFYAEFETLIPEEKVLGSMLQQINFLPFVSEQRKEIFKELIDLYKNKKLFGFYALSLTQIEGLFTEMCRMCEPGFNSPYAALPDKVNIVRPYHQFSENRFDYFQYYLPNLRNRFLHYGLDANEKIEILCKEHLWDLEEVVSIFLGLNIDALWMLRLIRKREDADFMSVSGLCFYFKLLGSVKQKKQFGFFETEVKSLNEIYLPDVVYNVVFDLNEKTKALIETIYEPVKVQSMTNGFEVDLKIILSKNIVDNKEKVKTALKETFNWQFQSEIEELLQILKFIKSYKQHLDINFITADVQTEIEEVNNNYGDILNKIKLITLQIGKD